MLTTAPRFALAGVRILDFSRVLAAPTAAMILADLGAEIWKIEKPGIGDDTRLWTPPEINGQSCYYLCVNRNKKSLALDLGKPEGQALAKKLAVKADVVLENFKTGNMAKFGLDYESLKKINKGIIYCSITGYGHHGPYAEDPGYDVIASALGGMMNATGPANGEPCRTAVAVTDIMTGLYAHGAVLAALYNRKQTGLGQQINCNLLSTQLAAMINLASNYLNTGVEAKRLGTQHASIVPYQAFETSDKRWYVVGAGNNKSFNKLVTLMELPELLTDERFSTNHARVKNREPLLEILQKRFKEKPLAYWAERLYCKEIPAGPVNNFAEAFAHPQVKHLGLVKEVTHPKYGTVKIVGPPVEYSDIENKVRSAPPTLGEHTIEILQKNLDLSLDEIRALKDRKIVDFPEYQAEAAANKAAN